MNIFHRCIPKIAYHDHGKYIFCLIFVSDISKQTDEACSNILYGDSWVKFDLILNSLVYFKMNHIGAFLIF